MLIEKVAELKPARLLDIGCGCGHFTAELAKFCGRTISIDISLELLKRARKENLPAGIDLLSMDARTLAFADNSIGVVIERFSLHHMLGWDKAIDEMRRVAKDYVLIEEPIDDTRSEPKRNTIRAWQLYLDVQKELGIPHYRHIKPDELIAYFQKRGLVVETKIESSDELITVDDFFSEFDRFAIKTSRPDYWRNRLAELKREFEGKSLCHSDDIFICLKK